MMGTGEPYRPSNGSEGEDFALKWCAYCERDRDYRENGKGRGCPILAQRLFQETGPKEWIYGACGCPRCTAFVRVQEVAK